MARESLTPRELQILKALRRGRKDRVIAEELGIARHTVSDHVATILLKLQAQTRGEAIANAIRDHVINVDAE